MTALHVVLLVALVGFGAAIASSRGVERFVGWRYLFRRRRSPLVFWLTIVNGLVAAALPAIFLTVQWRPGGLAQSFVAGGAILALMSFTTLLFLNFLSVFTTVSISGVFCGVATLIVVLSVTSGFQEEFRKKVLGVNAHVIILKYGLDYSEYRDVQKKAEKVPHVVATAPFVFHEMMVAAGPRLSGSIIKGIVPGQSDKVLDVGQMTEGSMDVLGQSLAPNGGGPPLPGILLGKDLAKKLHVKIGDRVSIVAPLADFDPSLWTPDGGKAPKAREFRLGGVFSSGFDEYDRRLSLIHMKEGQAFVEGGDVVTGVEIKVDDIDRSMDVTNQLDDLLNTDEKGQKEGPYRVIDWRDLNHNLFTALELQKTVLAILLTLIVLVAAFGIVATLTMLVIDKTREIAILKSTGMRSFSIARMFSTAGMTIGALGVTSGLGIGLAICGLVSRYRYHLDPRVYLIDKLPVTVHPGEVLLTAVITLGICLVATIYPSLRAASLRPLDGLRYE